MKTKVLLTCGAMLTAMAVNAQNPIAVAFDSPKALWQDPVKNADNRKTDVSDFFAYESIALAEQNQSPRANVKAKSSRYLSMEGKWRFNFKPLHECGRYLEIQLGGKCRPTSDGLLHPEV